MTAHGYNLAGITPDHTPGGGGGGGTEGGLTNVELRATPVPVATGDLTNTQLRASPVPVVTGDLTDEELRASPVDVAGPLTDDELRASPVPVTELPVNVQIHDITDVASSGWARYHGITVHETSGDVDGTATVTISAPEAIIQIVQLAANETATYWFARGIGFEDDLDVVVVGTVAGSLYLSAAP